MSQQTMPHSIVLSRRCSQRTNDNTLGTMVHYMAKRALAGPRGRGWTFKISPINSQKDGDFWLFKCQIKFVKNAGHQKSEEQQWEHIATHLMLSARLAKWGKWPWEMTGLENKLVEKIEQIHPKVEGETEGNVVKPVKDYYVNLNLDPTKYSDNSKVKFEDLYERENQKAIVLSALGAAVESAFVNRFHVVVYGPPGCAKTDLLLAVANMLGKENEAYMKFDATSTTTAGASRILLESNVIPPVLIVEEIEKTVESSLHWLLSVSDQRAEVRRTNFRIGNMARNVKMLVLATVNDIALFEKVMSGALASRFPNKIYCPRPDRTVMGKILQREVQKVHGREEWIEPTLKFGLDEMHWDDPRKLIPICLQGKNDLLTGKYQLAIKSVQAPKP